MSEESSPDIIKRLSRLPPYDEPKVDVPVVTPPQVSQPEPKVEEPVEDIPVEQDIPEDEQQPEGEQEPTEQEEQISEEEALANSKNPERTKKYIDSLKSKISQAQPEVPQAPRPQLPNALDATEPEVIVSQPGVNIDAPVISPQVPMPNDFASPKNYPNLSQKGIDDIMNSLVSTDEEGNQVIDIDKLRVTLADANQREMAAKGEAHQAKEIAQNVERRFSDFEKTKEVQVVHGEFPELDPESGVFNEKYYDVVVNEMTSQLIKTGKRDFKTAAQKWSDTFRKEAEDVNKKDREKKESDTNAKKQINATVSKSGGQNRSGWNNHGELVNATRKGEKGALSERLKKSGY